MLEVLGRIGFDWQVALANLVNFIIIFFVLKKFAFGPIMKVIRERQEKIDEGLENARLAETDRIMAEELKKRELSEAKRQANVIVGEAQEKSNSILLGVKSEAESARAVIIADGERIAGEKKASAQREAEKEVAMLVVSGIEKVLRTDLTAQQRQEYMKKVLVR